MSLKSLELQLTFAFSTPCTRVDGAALNLLPKDHSAKGAVLHWPDVQL